MPTLSRALVVLVLVVTAGISEAATIYPIDRATILQGSRFDFKVEFDGRVPPDQVTVTINGVEHATVFGRPARFVDKEEGHEASALILRDVVLTQPGGYVVTASDGRS